MAISPSFFNWSLNKALDTEPDSLSKARIRILYTIILFSLLKAVIVIVMAVTDKQWLQVDRAVIVFALYALFAKILLYKPTSFRILSHLLLQIGIIVVFTNIFVYSHKINMVTVQFIFMIVLSSFYTLGSAFGITYSVMSISPVILFFIFKDNIHPVNNTEEITQLGFEIIAILNFLSIILCHFLFFKAFNLNIKEKEKLNKQLLMSIADANKLAESKTAFLSVISHELRTPLNSVIGVTELLAQDNPEERQIENLKILQFSTHELLSLINNVLDVNKMNSDKLVLEAIPFNLAEFIKDICSGLRIKAKDKKLNFILEIDDKLEKTDIISDPTRLSQIIYNLVGNAIKFTDTGSIIVKLSCVDYTESTINVLFSVTDTGIGIHPDRHETIFDLFTQAELDITRRYGGTGLGLAIVKQVVELFNSSIQLKSQPGKGSGFLFTISFIKAKEVGLVNTTALTNKMDLSHLKILIAEDNEINRLILKKQLNKIDVNPVIVENGLMAYEACLNGNYDAIFLDLYMPVLDGYETIKKIRAIPDMAKAKTYTIAFTASTTEQKEIFKVGFNDYLYKPVNIENLRTKLEEIALYKYKPAD